MVSLFPARIVSCRMLMDTGGQLSVLPLSLCQKLKPPVNLPAPTREVATYSNSTVKFHGTVPLHVQLCGLTILHPLYIVDNSIAGLAPAIGGYDLMKSGRMVLDIDNQLLWSHQTHSLTEHSSPNPTTSIPNTNVRSVVCFAELPSRDSPAVPSEADAVDPDPASIAPERSCVLSRQFKVVLPPVGLRVPVPRSVLSPSAPVFCPRADRIPPTGTVHPPQCECLEASCSPSCSDGRTRQHTTEGTRGPFPHVLHGVNGSYRSAASPRSVRQISHPR